MLFRRKPKTSPDQDDPLVPHGLIWQATAEQQRTRQPVPMSPAVPVAPPAKRARAQIEPRFKVPPSTRRLGAISPPIPWPSPMVQEIVRRPPSRLASGRVPAKSMEQITPAEYEKKPKISPAPAPKSEPVSRQQVAGTHALPSALPGARPRFRERFRGLGERRRALIAGWAKARLELGANVRTIYHEACPREPIKRASRVVGNVVQTCLLWPRRVKASLTSIALRFKTARAKLISIQEPLSRRMEEWSVRSTAASAKLLHHRVRVAVNSQPWTHRITSTKAIGIGGRARPRRLRFDSRLLTSMGMAALSAALTLTMISLIRHHLPEKAREQPRSLPSVVRPIPPAEARHVPSHSLGRRSALEKTNTVNSAVLAGQATRAGKAPRAHYSEDSDYVARDTYIYYGPKGKSEH